MSTSANTAGSRSSTQGWLVAAGLVAIVLHGLLLRFDAITLKYGPVTTPSWLQCLQQWHSPERVLRPSGVAAGSLAAPVGAGPPSAADGARVRQRRPRGSL